MNLSRFIDKAHVQVAIIALVVILAYANSVPNEFAFDDDLVLVSNPAVHGFSLENLSRVLIPREGATEHLPVRDLSYMFDFSFWRTDPRGYHLSNLIYYLLACLAFLIFVKELAVQHGSRASLLALIAALIFALHPVHVEAVAGISQRKILLSSLFLFSSLFCYLRFVRGGARRFYILALALCALTLLSFGATLVLPVIIVLMDLLLAPRREGGALQSILRSIPFFLLTAGLVGLNFFVMREAGILDATAQTSPAMQAGYGVRSFFIYLKMLVFPYPLTVRHVFTQDHGLFRIWWGAFAAGMGLLLLLAWLLRRRMSLVSFGLLWIVLFFLPTLTFASSRFLLSERYAYLPSAGFALAAAALLEAALRRGSSITRSGVFAFMAALLVLSAILVIRQNTVWKNSVTLYTDALRHAPGDVEMEAILAREYFDMNNYEEAFRLLADIKRRAPFMVDYEFYQSLAYFKNKDVHSARKILDRISSLTGMDILDVHVLYGHIYVRLGDRERAKAHYLRAVQSPAGLPSHYYMKVEAMRALKSLEAD